MFAGRGPGLATGVWLGGAYWDRGFLSRGFLSWLPFATSLSRVSLVDFPFSAASLLASLFRFPCFCSSVRPSLLAPPFLRFPFLLPFFRFLFRSSSWISLSPTRLSCVRCFNSRFSLRFLLFLFRLLFLCLPFPTFCFCFLKTLPFLKPCFLFPVPVFGSFFDFPFSP